MAKKSENNLEHSFSLFNSIGGIIGSIITIGTLTFGVGWAIGSWRTSNEYENKIRHSCISPWQYNHVIQRS